MASPGFDQDLCLSQSVKDLPIQELITHRAITGTPAIFAAFVDDIAGNGRVDAAKLLDLDTVPTICLAHLNEIERRAYLIAGNKIALNASWDQDLLAGEMQALIDHGIDIEDKGDIEAQRELIRIHQFHTKLERQSPRQGAAEQIVDVHLKIGDEKTERKVEQLLIEERIKERKAQGHA